MDACLETGLPQLPSTRDGVEAVLFPAQSEMRMPVQPWFYDEMNLKEPGAAQQLLQRADAGSPLVAALTVLSDASFQIPCRTDGDTAYLGQDFLQQVFPRLERYSKQMVSCDIVLNSTEP